MRKIPELVKAWRRLDTRRGPFFLPEDRQALTAILDRREYHQQIRSYRDFARSRDLCSEHPDWFHLNLLPIPYGGDILRARIFILSLNPGFGAHDYYAENHHKALMSRKRDELKQKGLRNKPFPWMALDPSFFWFSTYWADKLDGIATELVERKRCRNYRAALSYLSQCIAVLEYVPYHSISAPGMKPILESSKLVKSFVHKRLLPEARGGKALLIVTRHADSWEIQKCRNVIVYRAGETRGAHLSPNSRGGKAILRFLGVRKR